MHLQFYYDQQMIRILTFSSLQDSAYGRKKTKLGAVETLNNVSRSAKSIVKET